MFDSQKLTRIASTAAALALPHTAFASVGAGAGLPYEDTFSKIVTSLTGPWAWTVAIVCVIIFAWRAVERGGDLGGSTMTFLGPAFICTLLLGAKKLMTFFGQGAMLTAPPELPALWLAFGGGIVGGVLLSGWGLATLYSRWKRRRLQKPTFSAASAESVAFRAHSASRPHRFDLRIGEVWHTMFIGSTRSGKSVLIPFGTRTPGAVSSGSSPDADLES